METKKSVKGNLFPRSKSTQLIIQMTAMSHRWGWVRRALTSYLRAPYFLRSFKKPKRMCFKLLFIRGEIHNNSVVVQEEINLFSSKRGGLRVYFWEKTSRISK